MLVIFEDIFHLWSWQQNRLYVEIFTRRVCADRTRYFEPKRDLFRTLILWFCAQTSPEQKHCQKIQLTKLFSDIYSCV